MTATINSKEGHTMDRDNFNLSASEAADAFARELSDLGRKYGIGIFGPVQLFILEREDMAHDYAVDDESLMEFA